MRTLGIGILSAVLMTAAPAAAECETADASALLAGSRASFVGVLTAQEDGVASFVVTEVVTGPLSVGPLEVSVDGDAYDVGDDEVGVFLDRQAGSWVGDGCRTAPADELRAVAPGGGGLTNQDSHPEEPPYSLFLIGIGVVVGGVLVARRARRRG